MTYNELSEFHIGACGHLVARYAIGCANLPYLYQSQCDQCGVGNWAQDFSGCQVRQRWLKGRL